MTQNVTIEAGTLLADLTERTVTGLLLPYGEEGRTNLGRLTIDKGTVALPRDHSIVTANIGHDREMPVARAEALQDTPLGVVATFKVADTDEGDALLAEIDDKRQAGTPMRLSAEVKNLVIRAGRSISGALFGAAFVDQGAFPSAALLAELAPDTEEPAEPDETTEPDQGAENRDDEPAVEDEEPAGGPDDTKGEAVAVATAPNTVTAAKQAASEQAVTATGLFELIHRARATGDQDVLAKVREAGGDTLFAALTDVKIEGVGQVGTGVVQDAWLGELWDGKSYERKFIPLFTSGVLTSLTAKGFKFSTPPTVAQWSGNKTEIPSPAVAVEVLDTLAQRFAAGYDIGREFRDFASGQEVIEAFIRKLVNSYAKVSDQYALGEVYTAAEAGIVAPETYPTGVGDAMGRIVQGALAVVDNDATPSFAIVSTALYKDLAYTREEDRLAFLSTSLGLEDGQMESFRILPSGLLDADHVLVGAREAVRVLELPGSPIRVNAIDLARGGYDEAVFGYVAVLVEEPDALVLVGTEGS